MWETTFKLAKVEADNGTALQNSPDRNKRDSPCRGVGENAALQFEAKQQWRKDDNKKGHADHPRPTKAELNLVSHGECTTA